MSFGLKNAPAVSACLMADVMSGLTWNGAAIYLDDIIIGGTNFEKHINLLRVVFNAWEMPGSRSKVLRQIYPKNSSLSLVMLCRLTRS